jgi:hypothetical protein
MNMSEEPEEHSADSSRASGEVDSPIHLQLFDRRFPLKKAWFWGAVIFSVLGVWFIANVTFTDAAKRWLPYSEENAQLLVPAAPDGEEPIELLELTHTLLEGQIGIQGKLKNRTQQPIEDLVATLTVEFVGTLDVVQKDVPVTPNRIEPGAEALFEFNHPVSAKPVGYVVKFKLANGAIVRHKDSRFVTAQ